MVTRRTTEEILDVIECMTVVFTDVMKCRAASRNQFRKQHIQMADHSTTG